MTGKMKNALRTVAIIALSLLVWSGACYACYAYGMRQETNKLTEMLNPELATVADSLKWVVAVEEPMTEEKLKEKTQSIFFSMEYQIKLFGSKEKYGNLKGQEALEAGLFQIPDVADMTLRTESDPERGWELRVVETPLGSVTYRVKDEFVTQIKRIYTADSLGNAPINTPTEAVERARAYYNWGLPFPTNYDMVSAQRQGDVWFVTYHRTARLKNLPKLRSDSQKVVLQISALDGEMIQADCFDLPLIQSGTDQNPIEKELAVKFADQALSQNGIQGYVVQDATSAIVEPNFIFTKRADGSAYEPVCHLSRAVWLVSYLPQDKSQPGTISVYVDAYTGQVLGGTLPQ